MKSFRKGTVYWLGVTEGGGTHPFGWLDHDFDANHGFFVPVDQAHKYLGIFGLDQHHGVEQKVRADQRFVKLRGGNRKNSALWGTKYR